MTFYRYSTFQPAAHDYDGELVAPLFPNPSIVLYEYKLVRETEKGYWISIGGYDFGKIWIRKSSRKRYAYPTKQEALTNFIKRTERRIEIIGWQIDSAKIALEKAKNINI